MSRQQTMFTNFFEATIHQCTKLQPSISHVRCKVLRNPPLWCSSRVELHSITSFKPPDPFDPRVPNTHSQFRESVLIPSSNKCVFTRRSQDGGKSANWTKYSPGSLLMHCLSDLHSGRRVEQLNIPFRASVASYICKIRRGICGNTTLLFPGWMMFWRMVCWKRRVRVMEMFSKSRKATSKWDSLFRERIMEEMNDNVVE